ncbi:MAG: MerR family DNA-binding transcriptional regulator, partial [Anaerolineae bacterium]
MFKIGEFSKLSQVTVKTLRYYDEIGLLKPAKV